MIKQFIEQQLLEALEKAASSLNTPKPEPGVQDDLDNLNLLDSLSLKVERPKNPEHGDYAVNVSPLARFAKMPPGKIAETLEASFGDARLETNTIAGFINFKLSDRLFADTLIKLLGQAEPGKNQSMADAFVLLEYVSANPTGPLHIGHGRWAALGNSLQRIFEHCGAHVTPEFYINDAGSQMGNIVNSLWYRALELLETGAKFPQPVEGEPFPFYPGEYVIDLAQELLKQSGMKEKLLSWDNPAHAIPPEAATILLPFAKDTILAGQKTLLDRMGVPFEAWFSEQQLLHDRGLVAATLEKLKAEGFAYEKDGAWWFKSTDFGDEKDRVLLKSDGSFTYLTADIAYHDHKFSREDDEGRPQYNRVINIWGADHHGYIPRLRGSIEALGHPVNEFEVILGQLVNLIIDGEKTRMGKRKKMLTLEDVVDEVGVDATRFWMVSKSADTALDFDVNLAASATDENPVFYAQYAHARCASILRNAVEDPTGQTRAPLTQQALDAYRTALSADSLKPLFDGLNGDEPEDGRTKSALKALILKLDGFEDLVADAARLRAPHLIARYALDLAAEFHSFYNVCRILTPETELTQARLMLVLAVKNTLAQALSLLGVSAPEKM